MTFEAGSLIVLLVNRYKDISLEIVRRWFNCGGYFVDDHVTQEMMDYGCLISVVGPMASGKTSLALQIAKRIHEKSGRCPAVIDEPYFERFINKPVLVGDSGHRPRPFFKIHRTALLERVPVVVPLTTRRQFTVPAQFDAICLRSTDMALLSSVIWVTYISKNNKRHYATLMKSRASNRPIRSTEFLPTDTLNTEDSPYLLRGAELARLIERLYG